MATVSPPKLLRHGGLDYIFTASHRLVLAPSVSSCFLQAASQTCRRSRRRRSSRENLHQARISIRCAPLHSGLPAGRSVHFIISLEIGLALAFRVDAFGAYLFIYLWAPVCTRGDGFAFHLHEASPQCYRDFPTAGARLPACLAKCIDTYK